MVCVSQISSEAFEPAFLKENLVAEDELGISVLKSACDSEAKNVVVDWAEFGLKGLTEGVLKDAPMLKTVVSICSVSRTIRDHIFVRKVWDFLRACPKFNDLEKLGFVREHLDDPEKAHKLGSAIVLILDKLDDLEKTKMLAKIFAALVRKHIDYADFRRLASGLDRAFVEDLKILAADPPRPELKSDKFCALLLPAGFAVTAGGVSRGGALGPQTNVNSLGRLFRKCIMEE